MNAEELVKSQEATDFIKELSKTRSRYWIAKKVGVCWTSIDGWIKDKRKPSREPIIQRILAFRDAPK